MTLNDNLYEGRWIHISHLKEFIKWCEDNSEVVFGVSMIPIFKIKEQAGEELVKWKNV